MINIYLFVGVTLLYLAGIVLVAKNIDDTQTMWKVYAILTTLYMANTIIWQ